MKSFISLRDFLVEEEFADAPTTITLAKTLERAIPFLKTNDMGDVILDIDDGVYTLRKGAKNVVYVELFDKKMKKIIDQFTVKQAPYVDKIIKIMDRAINKNMAVH